MGVRFETRFHLALMPRRRTVLRQAQHERVWGWLGLVTPLLLLAACGQRADDPGLGGLSHSEASQLNDAAAMLDANSVSADAVTTTNDQEQAQ